MTFKELRFWLHIRKEAVTMRKLLQGAQWANAAILLAQILAQAGIAFPGLAMHPAFLAAQAVLGAILPSLGGVSHIVSGTQVVPVVKP